MRTPRTQSHSGQAAGFTLPAILIVTGALLILAATCSYALSTVWVRMRPLRPLQNSPMATIR